MSSSLGYRIGLGTVQFGRAYGITNRTDKTPPAEVRRILAYARDRGVRVLDTAATYGNSERVLGSALLPDDQFLIVTKSPPIGDGPVDEEQIGAMNQALQASLAALGRRSVYGLLIHDAADLEKKGGERLFAALEAARARGLASKIGVSVYRPEEIDRLLSRFDFDLVQIPINVFDQRMRRSGQLDRLCGRGVEIHARSTLLQGLLLADPKDLPEHFLPVFDHFVRYHRRLVELGVTPLAAALGFVMSLPEIDTLICGVETRKQLEEIVDVVPPTEDFRCLDEFALDDDRYVNPVNWLIR